MSDHETIEALKLMLLEYSCPCTAHEHVAGKIASAIRSNKIPGLAIKAYDGTTCWLCDKCGKTRDGKGCRTCDANEIGRLRELVRSAYEEGYRYTGSESPGRAWQSSSARRALSGE